MIQAVLNSIREQRSLKSERRTLEQAGVSVGEIASEIALTSRPADADENSDAESGTDGEDDEDDEAEEPED